MDENVKTLFTLVEASLYEAPTAPGLTFEEIVSLGTAFGKAKGELSDALRCAETALRVEWVGQRIVLANAGALHLDGFHGPVYDPDPRNPKAFDFILSELKEIGRQESRSRAVADEEALIAKGESSGLARRDLEVAVAILVLVGHLVREKSLLRLPEHRYGYPAVSEQIEQSRQLRGFPAQDRPLLRKALPLVRDLIARRTDARPASPDPVMAFGKQLPSLGYERFALWWEQTVAEWRQASGPTTPTASAVLSAALVEAALAFVAAHAQRGGAMTRNFNGPPTSWKLSHLLQSAKTGADPLLDDPTVARGLKLNELRQRIHAGHWVDAEAGPMPDVNSEVAEEARQTMRIVLRGILDWLQRHPE